MSRSVPRIVVFATHPIQNHAPWFRALVAEGVDLVVFFSLLPDARQQAVGFGGAFSWDTPLLEGYAWVQLQQARRDPALGSFRGLRNREVGRTLARHAPDVVVLTGWHALPLLQGVWAALLLGIPRVIRGDSNALRPRSSWKSAGHRALFSLYDAFVGMGTANRALYEANGVPPERIFDGGHFVDDQLFLAEARREAHHREKRRSAWGVPPEACCLLFAGKLQEKKRPLDFIRAVATAAVRLPAGAIHGLVVGSGDLEPEARDLAASLGAPVTFTGFLNQGEIGRAYAAADALVLPSDFGETWGLVVNEGMLFGLPAVVSDRVGCGPDLVEDGETGFVFPFGDVAALAACMERLACDRSGRMAMGQRAGERVVGYSPARGARATIAAARLAMGL